MAFREPSTEEKHAFFTELDRLGALSDSDENNEADAKNDEERRRWRAALPKPARSHKASKLHPLSQPAIPRPSQIKESPTIITPQSPSSPVHSVTKSTRPPLKPIHPRRVLSDPSTRAHSPAPSPNVPDATQPGPSRAPLQPISLERSTSTPNPSRKPSLPQETKESSSSMASGKSKRKGRSSAAPKVLNTMFTDMAFYFIQDNDIEALRRMRIQKVLEGNGRWTRTLQDATHIIVDDHLKWKDIERIVALLDDPSSVHILKGLFITACAESRTLANHNEPEYQVDGYPGKTPVVSRPAASSNSVASEKSLELKPAQRNPNRWDHVPAPSTPSRSEDSSQRNSGQTGVEPHDQHGSAKSSRAASPEATPLLRNQESKFNDDLSAIIVHFKQVWDLPLDSGDDDADSVHNPEDVDLDSDSEAGSEEERVLKRRKTEKQGRKTIALEERFACNKGGTLDGKKEECPNARTIEILQRMCDHYERTGETWRNVSYRKAISTLKTLPYKVTTARQAKSIVNIGDSISRKIEEIVTTDRLRRLEYAEQEPADIILKTFLRIYGVGTAQANRWIAKGYRTLDDLTQKAKLTTNQKIGIERYDDLNTRIPRREVEALGAHVKVAAAKIDQGIELIIGGSYRRGAPNSGDIDFIVSKKGTTSAEQLLAFLLALTQSLEKEGFLVAKLAASSKRDGSKWHGCCVLPKPEGVKDEDYRPIWRRIDFLVVPESEMGAALIYFTGNDIFNRSIRLLASNKGMRLNQRGLYKDVMRGPARVKVTEGALLESRDEKMIFEILGVKWRQPDERWC